MDINFSVSIVEFLAPNQDVDYAQALQGRVTLTNPETGATVINQFAGRYTESFVVSGDPEGIHTREFNQIGLGEQWRLENGRVLTLDAGYLAVRETWNGDQFLSFEDVVNKGPHPDADSDFALFCEVVPAALALQRINGVRMTLINDEADVAVAVGDVDEVEVIAKPLEGNSTGFRRS